MAGYSKKVTLSLASAPSGVTATFATNPVTPGGSTTVTVKVSASAMPGTYTIVFKGVGEDGKEATTSLSLTVEEKLFDFAVTVSPNTLVVNEGQDAVITVDVNLVSGSGKPVTLSLTGLPSGTTYSFSTTTVTPTGSSTLTIKTSDLTGTYTVTVKGTYGAAEKTDSFTLEVKEFDFTVSISPNNVEINQGETASIIVTVSLASGAAKEVTLTAVGIPAGATYSFNPSKVTPPGSSVLTINTGSAKGSYTIVIKGTGDGKERTDTLLINIKEKACFVATATYGSEVSNEVNILREFRDDIVLSTYAGQRFYVAFDAFYYSWSPQIAQAILAHQGLIAPLRITLYPLIGTLLLATSIATPIAQVSGELAVYLAMTIISSLLGIIYLTPSNLILSKITKKKIFAKKTAKKLIYLTLGLLTTSIAAQALTLDIILTATTFIYAFTLAITSAYLTTTYILDIRKRK